MNKAIFTIRIIAALLLIILGILAIYTSGAQANTLYDRYVSSLSERNPITGQIIKNEDPEVSFLDYWFETSDNYFYGYRADERSKISNVFLSGALLLVIGAYILAISIIKFLQIKKDEIKEKEFPLLLTQYKELLDKEIISQEEFDSLKSQILNIKK